MHQFRKTAYALLVFVLAAFMLGACDSSDESANSEVTNTDVEHTQQGVDNSEQTDAVKKGAAKMQQQTSKVQDALKQQDVDKVKTLGKKLNDQWLTFENEVRDRFPLLYTNVEKYQQPIYAQSTLDQPDLTQMEGQAQNLQKALDELKNAKETTQKTNEVLNQAVQEYQKYVINQTCKLVSTTKEFVNAVKAGNTEKAKALYPKPRVYYERIEPIAESFGDLDPNIDARVNDVDDKSNWTGFHRLEKALWKNDSLDGQGRYADQLLEDVNNLKTKMQKVDLKPEQVVAGSMELLNEAAISKITGEEERYSHLDLVDLAANVEGSEAVYHAIIPALQENNKELAEKLDEQFRSFNKVLQQYKKNGQYMSYKKLSKDQIRELSQQLSQLSEYMAQTAKIF